MLSQLQDGFVALLLGLPESMGAIIILQWEAVISSVQVHSSIQLHALTIGAA